MGKRVFVLSLCVLLLLCALVGCANKENYDTDWIIGKTSSEIIDNYGAFDCITMDASEDGLYKNCKCGYTITEEKQGFLSKSEEVLLFVHFDENGVATKCEEGYRPGG